MCDSSNAAPHKENAAGPPGTTHMSARLAARASRKSSTCACQRPSEQQMTSVFGRSGFHGVGAMKDLSMAARVDLFDGPAGVFGNQRLGIMRGFFEGGK